MDTVDRRISQTERPLPSLCPSHFLCRAIVLFTFSHNSFAPFFVFFSSSISQFQIISFLILFPRPLLSVHHNPRSCPCPLQSPALPLCLSLHTHPHHYHRHSIAHFNTCTLHRPRCLHSAHRFLPWPVSRLLSVSLPRHILCREIDSLLCSPPDIFLTCITFFIVHLNHTNHAIDSSPHSYKHTQPRTTTHSTHTHTHTKHTMDLLHQLGYTLGGGLPPPPVPVPLGSVWERHSNLQLVCMVLSIFFWFFSFTAAFSAITIR